MFRKSIHEVLALHTRQLTDLKYDHAQELKYLDASLSRDIRRTKKKLVVNANRTTSILLKTGRVFRAVNSAFYAIFDWCKRGIDSTEWYLKSTIESRQIKYYHKITPLLDQLMNEQDALLDVLSGK